MGHQPGFECGESLGQPALDVPTFTKDVKVGQPRNILRGSGASDCRNRLLPRQARSEALAVAVNGLPMLARIGHPEDLIFLLRIWGAIGCHLKAPPSRKEREKGRAPAFEGGESMGQPAEGVGPAPEKAQWRGDSR
jgi:hypothetical protein